MIPTCKQKDGLSEIQVLKGTLNNNRSQLLKKNNLISFSAYLDFSAEEEIKQHENILKIPSKYCPEKEFIATSLDIIGQDNNRNVGRILIYKTGDVSIQHKVSNNLLKSIAFTITYLI